jgi:hypothetical protein
MEIICRMGREKRNRDAPPDDDFFAGFFLGFGLLFGAGFFLGMKLPTSR